tara:strand:- start:1563 stop:2144 length:582 start_codon:yes stop_codon:yes gene_type:complete
MIYPNVTLSSKNKYVWFRNPKVASTTILHHLHENTDVSYCSRQDLYKLESTYPIKGMFKFTFVRNPWDRLASFYINNYESDKKNKEKPLPANTFDEFVEIIDSSDVSKCNRHFILQTCIYPVNDIDFLGHFENFNNDFNYVCDTLRIKTKNWGHRNRSKRSKRYTEYYDSKTKKIVERKYAQDIELLKYKFGD